jgi:hypothetical protein
MIELNHSLIVVSIAKWNRQIIAPLDVGKPSLEQEQWMLTAAPTQNRPVARRNRAAIGDFNPKAFRGNGNAYDIARPGPAEPTGP